MQQTSHFQLSQWEGEDRILRENFNSDNAIKYNRPGGRVDITVTPEDGAVVLTVSDTGVGIPKDSQSRIFERFYRVDKSRSKAVGGTGLGLSIVKHAALIQKADVRVESEPGEGSTFTATFPEK